MNKYILMCVSIVFVGCTTSNKSTMNKVILDSSKNRSDWVDNPKLSWIEDNKIFVKSTHTVRGDQKLNGCYTLANLDAKENLLSEMSNDIKGAIDTAELDLNENAETVLGKVRSSKFEGTVYGFKMSEQFYERYLVNGVERIDCSVLSEISKADYDKTKRFVVDKVVAADPRVKEAILKKQLDFFSSREPSSQSVVKTEDK